MIKIGRFSKIRSGRRLFGTFVDQYSTVNNIFLYLPLEGTAYLLGVLRSPEGHSQGDRLLTSCVDGTARLWNISTGQELVKFKKDQPEELVMASFSPDGEFIATSGTDSVVRIWDLSGALLAEPPIENGNLVTALAFSADSSQLAAGTPFSHPIWDPSGLAEGQSPKLVLTIPGELNPVNGLYFNLEGSRLVTANSSGKTKVWDTATGKMLLELLPSEAMLSSASTSDGNTVFIGYENGQVKAWNTATLGNGEWLSLPKGNYYLFPSDLKFPIPEDFVLIWGFP